MNSFRDSLTARGRLVFPLDEPGYEAARASALQVGQSVGVLKIGLQLFTAQGPKAVTLGHELGLPVFLDLKLHDIPQTVENAVQSAAALGVDYLTVHASGGLAMLERAAAAAEACSSARGKRLTLLAVTVLTSLDAGDLEAQGIAEAPLDHVLRLAKLAWKAGIRGFVASAEEAPSLRTTLGEEALIVTPGIRPDSSLAMDQKRVATPAQAIADGADLLVVGRPIKNAPDPLLAAQSLVNEIERALACRAAPQQPKERR